MKNVAIIVLVLALAGAGVFLWPRLQEGKAENAAASVNIKTGPVEVKDINFRISVAGEITPKEEVSVRPEVNGRINELPVDVGDRVKKGTLLFALDDEELQIEIASRQTEIDSARLQLEKARRDFERDRELYEANLIAREVFEDARTIHELAKTQIERTERALDLARDRLSKTRIEAPFDCTVLTRPITGVGQAVSGSGGFNSGTEVMTIANLEEMVIHAHVNQVDVARMKEGQEVEVRVEAISGLKVKGKIQRIAPQATIRNGIKGFAVRVLIVDLDPRIQPGMTANISIPVSSAHGVVVAPLAAVFTEFNMESGRSERFAYVKRGQKFERRILRVGIADYFHAEILAGLEPGEIVATELPPPQHISNLPSDPGPGGMTQQGITASGT